VEKLCKFIDISRMTADHQAPTPCSMPRLLLKRCKLYVSIEICSYLLADAIVVLLSLWGDSGWRLGSESIHTASSSADD